METKKLVLEVGERGRVIAEVRRAVVADSIEWKCASTVVLINEAEQNTPLDMRVVAIAPGMAYVEFSAVTPDGERLSEMVEVHVVPATPPEAPVAMRVRHHRAGGAGETPASEENGQTAETEVTEAEKTVETSPDETNPDDTEKPDATHAEEVSAPSDEVSPEVSAPPAEEKPKKKKASKKN